MCWIQDIIRRRITSNKQENYQKTGQLLINARSEDAKKIIARTELFPEGGAMRDLTELLVELRTYYIDNKLTNGRSACYGGELALDVGRMKLGIEFRYTG